LTAVGARAVRLADQSRQLRRRFNRFPPTDFNNFPRNATSERLFADAKQQIGQFALREGSEELRSSRAGGGVKPHVQRSIRHEAESPSRIVHLGRAKPEVGQNDVRLHPQFSTKHPHDLSDGGKVATNGEGLATGLPPDSVFCERKVPGVDIQENDRPRRTDGSRKFDRVPPAASGAIDHRLARLGGEFVEALAEKDRQVTGHGTDRTAKVW
jgi:hypothetical protein